MVQAAPVRVAIIPARGGSKRIPRKNLRLLDGRPLVAWAIDTCLSAGVFDRVVVTTDDDEIASAASDAGADVPFMREAELGDDFTPLVPVVADALERLGYDGDVSACCVYPTSVGLLPADLTHALHALQATSSAPYVVSVVRFAHPIQRALSMDDSGFLAMVDPTTSQTRTQDLEPRWHDAGQFIWGQGRAWLARMPVLTNAVGFELPAWRTVDLDTEDDWARAELLHRMIQDRALG